MKFLVIDDDRWFRIRLQKILLDFGSCHTAYDGGEGLNAFRIALEEGDPYDYVFVDIAMPHIDGHQVLQNLRTIQRRRGIADDEGVRIIVTTAKEDADECFRTYLEGSDFFLAKPIRPEDVIQCLWELRAAL